MHAAPTRISKSLFAYRICGSQSSGRMCAMASKNASAGPLDQIPLFAELSPAMLAVLERESRVRRYPDGQVLFSEGDPGDALLILEEGRVKVSRFTASGQEIVL